MNPAPAILHPNLPRWQIGYNHKRKPTLSLLFNPLQEKRDRGHCERGRLNESVSQISSLEDDQILLVCPYPADSLESLKSLRAHTKGVMQPHAS